MSGNGEGPGETEKWRNLSNKQLRYGTPVWHFGEAVMAKRNTRKDEAQIDESGSDLGQAGSDSAGQSGDVQGLSQVADVDEESVGELAETEQTYEAEVVEGIEDAGDHPERPVRTREDKAQ